MSTQWEHWKAEIELFCHNYCKLMEPKVVIDTPPAAPLKALTHPSSRMELDASQNNTRNARDTTAPTSSVESEDVAQGTSRTTLTHGVERQRGTHRAPCVHHCQR